MHRADQPIGNNGKGGDRHKVEPQPPKHERHTLQPCPARSLSRRMGIQLVAEAAQNSDGDPFGNKAKAKHQNDFPGSIQHAVLNNSVAHD